MMITKTADLWEQVLIVLENKVSSDNMENWIRPVRCIDKDGKALTLVVPNKYHQDWLIAHFYEEIRQSLIDITGQMIPLELKVESELVNEAPKAETPAIEVKQPESLEIFHPLENNLNPKYTFDTFVVGSNNRLAHAACLAVSDNPAKAYNPLFLYGGVGLGKTHLLHAICHQALKTKKASRVLYTSAEQFMNAFITAVTHSRRQDFQAVYRNIDILLIDDIHFLAGKEGTQEEFFHTFNALHGAHKQIVVSSDRPPKEIPTLQERLLSRFEWGLIADIQQPDLETRMAILQKKAEQEKIQVPTDVLLFIADNIQSNIRQLEGCLIRIAASASLTGTEITLDMAKKVLHGILELKREQVIDLELVQQIVVEYYKISMDELLGKRRTKGVVEPRQVAMYLCRQMTQKSFPEIGSAFGGRDHTTIMHACEKVETDISKDHNFRRVVNHLIEQIQGKI
jgi:chromosomal replication initiator protein